MSFEDSFRGFVEDSFRGLVKLSNDSRRLSPVKPPRPGKAPVLGPHCDLHDVQHSEKGPESTCQMIHIYIDTYIYIYMYCTCMSYVWSPFFIIFNGQIQERCSIQTASEVCFSASLCAAADHGCVGHSNWAGSEWMGGASSSADGQTVIFRDRKQCIVNRRNPSWRRVYHTISYIDRLVLDD